MCCRRLQRPCPFCLGLAERGQTGWGQGVLNVLMRTLHPARTRVCTVLTTVSCFMCWAVQCSNESVFGADFHPTDCNILVTCGKSHLYFWNLEKGLLVKKQGLFEVGHQTVPHILNQYHKAMKFNIWAQIQSCVACLCYYMNPSTGTIRSDAV